MGLAFFSSQLGIFLNTLVEVQDEVKQEDEHNAGGLETTHTLAQTHTQRIHTTSEHILLHKMPLMKV